MFFALLTYLRFDQMIYFDLTNAFHTQVFVHTLQSTASDSNRLFDETQHGIIQRAHKYINIGRPAARTTWAHSTKTKINKALERARQRFDKQKNQHWFRDHVNGDVLCHSGRRIFYFVLRKSHCLRALVPSICVAACHITNALIKSDNRSQHRHRNNVKNPSNIFDGRPSTCRPALSHA